MSALKLGDPESRYLAESYIEKCLIIRNCRGRTTREITEYLQPLANRDKDAWAEFYEDFDLIMDELKARAKALRTAPTKTPAPDPTPGAQSGKFDRHVNTGDVSKGFSQLQVGPKADYDKAAYSSSPGKGYAVPDSDSYYPKARHAADPAQTAKYHTATYGGGEERAPPAQRRDSQAQLPPIAPLTTIRPRHDPNESAFEDIRSQHSELVPSLRGDAMPRVVAIESKLDPRYKKKQPRAAGDFFIIGRVFAMLWHTEHTADDVSRAKWTMTVMGAQVFSHIRRFAVVKQGHGYCWAVPINTYNGQGVKKKGFHREDIKAHAIIFTQGSRAMPLNNEPTMVKSAIEVVPADSDCELGRASRINFSKVHTVE
jgi:hypothetical protein